MKSIPFVEDGISRRLFVHLGYDIFLDNRGKSKMSGMNRDAYRLFSPANVGKLKIKNRLVRSATWDPCLFAERVMTAEVLNLYRELAQGGVGLIITGS